MRTISCKLEDLKNMVLHIGYEGENDYTSVRIDAGSVFAQYPDAVPSMKVQPPKGNMYPAIVTRDGDIVIWNVSDSDTASNGNGEIQLTFTENTVVVKSCTGKTLVHRSLKATGPAPDPLEDFIETAEEVLDDLEAMDTIAKNAQDSDIGKSLSPKTVENGVVTEWQYVEPGGGTEDYDDLDNKPSIDGVTLAGDKSLHELGIAAENAIPDVSGKANLTVIAPAFDQATANDEGSLVTYTDGVVYVLLDGHTAGTTWANTTKTATNIDTELRLQKNAIQGLEDDKYEKPFGGIPSTDMTQAVQDALNDAETAYQKPQTGIPASDLANGTIPVLHNVPAGGSTGQYLKKASGTDYDLEWGSSAAPTDEQVASAVENYLDEHPEATTTVQDGAVTIAKLHDDVAGAVESVDPMAEYFGVIGKSKEVNTAENIIHPQKITFVGNPYAFTNCRVANRKNYITKVDAGESDLGGVTFKKRAGVLFYELNGTATSTKNGSTVWDNSVSIPAGTYRFILDISIGNSTITYWTQFQLRYKYEGESSYNEQNLSVKTTGSYVDITFTKKVIALNPRVGVFNGNVYSGYLVWMGLYKSDVTIIDTEHSVSNGSTYDYTFTYDGVFETIDTMQHKSFVESVVPTRKAIPFVTPEMFGAVGDENTDDTDALQNCIDYAIANKCMVYGKGEYRVTKTIKINGSYGNYCIRKIGAWSNTVTGYILEIEGSHNKIDINYIASQYGVRVTAHSNTNTKNNYINIRTMNISVGDAITLEGDDSLGESTYVSYNQFFIGTITASVGNCVTNNDKATENWFFGGMMICPSGWAFYNPQGIKCVGASFEKDCYGGIYCDYGAGGMFVNCRHIEMTDKICIREYEGQANPGGTLIKFVGAYQNIVYIANSGVPYEAIDTSEATDVTDPSFDVDPDYDWRPSWKRSASMSHYGIIKAQIQWGHDNNKGGCSLLGNEMHVVNGRKICISPRKSIYTITEADYDMSDVYGSQNHNFIYATRYKIDIADCVIHLATSYCCEGYNELIIDQTDPTKLCTVYKASDSVTPIFDGQTAGAGVYKLSCICDYSLTKDKLPDDWTKPSAYYNGYNDVWTVEKLS